MAPLAIARLVVGGPKKRVLVVDDEDYIREGFSAVIRGLGVEVVLAADGAQAIKELRKGNFALMVLDLNLPGISGLRVLEWVSQNAQDMPVLVVTGLENPPNVMLRFPNLVKIMEKKPVRNDVLSHLVELYALEE
jgi:CheY-like chemotaxis protein